MERRADQPRKPPDYAKKPGPSKASHQPEPQQLHITEDFTSDELCEASHNSSAQITKSLGPKGCPSQIPAYRSSTRAALVANRGSRTEIQDRCCQGLSASSASHRRTEDADTATRQRTATSRAISGQ